MNAPIAFGLVLLVGSWTSIAVAAPPTGVTNQKCIECHKDPTVAKPGQGKEGEGIDMQRYAKSAHADVACVKCHADAKADTHTGGLERVDCGSCHAKQSGQLAEGAHSSTKTSVVCADCHGTHDTLAVKDPDSQVFRTKLGATCGRCHDAKQSGKAAAKGRPAFVRDAYEQSVHFRGMTDDGLDRLGDLQRLPRRSRHGFGGQAELDPVFRANVPSTCGTCHEGLFEKYMAGVHGQALVTGNADTPVCTDCHGEHGMRGKSDPASSVYATSISKTTCPQCHSAEHVNRRYGLPVDAGRDLPRDASTAWPISSATRRSRTARAATAHTSSCNSSNPKSSVNAANLAVTCGKCHPGAGPNFAKGSVHSPERATGGGALRWVKTIYLARHRRHDRRHGALQRPRLLRDDARAPAQGTEGKAASFASPWRAAAALRSRQLVRGAGDHRLLAPLSGRVLGAGRSSDSG